MRLIILYIININIKQSIFRNFGLLSFGEEAEDDEQETTIFVKQNAGKAKSLHDATDDPKLSKEPLKVPKTEPAEIEESRLSDDYEEPSTKPTSSSSDAVKSKLAKLSKASKKAAKPVEVKSESESDDGDMLMTREQEQRLKASSEKYVYSLIPKYLILKLYIYFYLLF